MPAELTRRAHRRMLGAVQFVQLPLPPGSPVSAPVRLRILLVDDEPVLRDALARLLGGYGCEVTTAAHGLEVLDRLARDSYDVIVSDIDMPEMDGLTFRDRVLAQDPALRHRFLLCSGSVFHGQRVDPAIHFLQKPFDGVELLATMQRLFAEWPGNAAPRR